MTTPIDKAQPEALRLAQWLRDRQSHLGPSRWSLRHPEEREEWDDYDKAAIALESLHGEAEALRADAARWQYVAHTLGEYCVVDAVKNTIGVLKGAALDAVVDAAMKEKTP